MVIQTAEEILTQAIRNKDVKFLTKYYFDILLTNTQEQLVREIVYQHYKRFSVSAMTRYGKTASVAIAIGLFILLNRNKKIFFVAPTAEQSMILRDYLAGFVRNCPDLLAIADLSAVDDEKLTIQRSRAHQTFKNGCLYRVFTAHDEADTLMGYGLGNEGGILVIDEACQIKNEAYAKIMRMLGDNPDKTILVELYNPWKRDCKAFEHSIDPAFRKYHINWEIALSEGRTTLEFIESQRKDMTSLEFEVLYNSNFPLESEDAIFNLGKINEAIEKGKIIFEANTRIISCDVADKGLDKTVIMIGKRNKDTNDYLVEEIYSEDKSENVNIAGKINNLIVRSRHFERIIVNIDTIGVGTGVVSMVKEFVKNSRLHVEVNGCHYGERPIDQPERFHNIKAEAFFRLQNMFDSKKIGIIDNKQLTKELLAMKWKFSSTNKIIIEDPDKSPDFADCLVYFVWKPKKLYQGGYLS